MTPDNLRWLADTVRDMIHLRLDAGDHPDDVAMQAWNIFEDVVRVCVDGAYPGRST